MAGRAPVPRPRARRRARALVALAAVLGFLLPGIAVAPSALAQSGDQSTIVASASSLTFGEEVTFSGSLATGDPACLGPRPITLQAKEAEQPDYVDLEQGITAADGTVSFSRAPEHSANFRLSVEAFAAGTVACEAVLSNHVPVDVAALVQDASSRSHLAAGACTTITVTVQPPKPGEEVLVERKRGGTWKTLVSPELDEDSSAAEEICFEWGDIGTVRLRASWTPQDGLNEAGVGPVLRIRVVEARWMRRLDDLTSGHAISVSVGRDDLVLYERLPTVARAPASNEKLLLSMVLLDRLGKPFTITTHAAATGVGDQGVVHGDLWILGRGDPSIDSGDISTLAEAVVEAGVVRVAGSVMGSTGYFKHDWSAPGWKADFPKDQCALPSALTFNGNTAGGVHISDPERRAAEALTDALRERGVRVGGKPGAGPDPAGLEDVATIESPRLTVLLHHQNVHSVNFYAETLGKLLGVDRSGTPGTIAKGAAALHAWANEHGAALTAYDSSGLSYDNRVTSRGILKLLFAAEDSTWGAALRSTLPSPGKGTLEHRLAGVQVRAKTGTLTDISALSGWVWLERANEWAEFSILAHGPTDASESLEDQVVRLLSNSGR